MIMTVTIQIAMMVLWQYGFEENNCNVGIVSGNAWILTRSRHPTLDVMEQAYSVVDKHGISRAYFIRTDQKNCPTLLY